MTHSDEFIGTLEDYLDGFDGATPLPERVSDASCRAATDPAGSCPTGL